MVVDADAANSAAAETSRGTSTASDWSCGCCIIEFIEFVVFIVPIAAVIKEPLSEETEVLAAADAGGRGGGCDCCIIVSIL